VGTPPSSINFFVDTTREISGLRAAMFRVSRSKLDRPAWILGLKEWMGRNSGAPNAATHGGQTTGQGKGKKYS